MVKGTLGIIYCPMLEDELLYSLGRDDEIDRIILLANPFCQSLREKMDSRGLEYEYVPEEGFDQGRLPIDHEQFTIILKANDLALHAEPAKLKAHIEKQVTDIQPYVDALGLYYGMCGNFGWDIAQWCRDMGYKPTSVFRGEDGIVCDDCVAVAIGGSSMYKKLVRRYTGMFFMTPAIVGNWRAFISAGELGKELQNIPKETLEELGITSEEDYMRWMFELGHYEHSLIIDTGLGDTEKFLAKCDEVSQALNLKPITIEDGWVTLHPAEAIYAECRANLN